jgi:hypothetical protein
MRKKRSDSLVAQIEMMSSKPPEPPTHIKLEPKDMPFWLSIICARDFSSWNNSDLEHAANLARCKATIDRLQVEVKNEPDIVNNAAGSPIVNPKHKLIQDLTRQTIALSRLIHIHAEATCGPSRKQRNRNQAQRELQESIKNTDDLIAKPIQ